MWGDIAIAFVLAFIIAFVVTPYSIKLAEKVGAIDNPKEKRKVNTKPMPRLRRNSSNCWIRNLACILINSNEFRRNNKLIWR